jgi:hypothetical protein
MGLSFGQDMVCSYSWKQKIVTKSSTKAELVGVDDSLGYILWAKYFKEGQGYNMEPLILYQDNMSTILLETNGKASISRRTKHIKVKYFYKKEKVDKGEIIVKHCPTDQMWTDIYTKPKQGKVFREFCGHVMGIPDDYDDDKYNATIVTVPPKNLVHPVSATEEAPKECVGECEEQAHNLTTARPGDVVKRVPIIMVQGKPWSPGSC